MKIKPVLRSSRDLIDLQTGEINREFWDWMNLISQKAQQADDLQQRIAIQEAQINQLYAIIEQLI